MFLNVPQWWSFAFIKNVISGLSFFLKMCIIFEITTEIQLHLFFQSLNPMKVISALKVRLYNLVTRALLLERERSLGTSQGSTFAFMIGCMKSLENLPISGHVPCFFVGAECVGKVWFDSQAFVENMTAIWVIWSVPGLWYHHFKTLECLFFLPITFSLL